MRRSTLLLLISTYLSIHSISQQPTLVIQQGHKSRILVDDFNRKEAAWLTVDENEAFCWNIPTGRQLQRISLSSRIRGGAFVNNGEEIVLAAYDYSKESSLYFYNAKTGEETGKLEFFDSTYRPTNRRKNWRPIDELVRSKDGATLAVLSFDKIYFVNASTRTITGELKLPTYKGLLGYLTDNSLLFAYNVQKNLVLVKYDKFGTEVKRVETVKELTPTAIELDPNQPLIALGSKDGSILILDEELELINEIEPGNYGSAKDEVSSLSFNSNAKELLISAGASIYRYDIEKKQSQKFGAKNVTRGEIVAFCPTDENNILSYYDNIPYQYEWSTAKKVHTYYVNSPGMDQFFFNSAENKMISRIMELDLITGATRKLFELSYDEEVLAPVSDSVVLCSYKRMERIKEEWVTQYGVQAINIKNGKVEFLRKLPFKSVPKFGVVSTDESAIAVSEDLYGNLAVLSGPGYSKVSKVNVKAGDRLKGLAFTPDGKSLITGSGIYGDTLKRYDIEKRAWSVLVNAKAPVFNNYLPISADGRYLLVGIVNFFASQETDFTQLGFYDLRENKISKRFKVEEMVSQIAINNTNDLFAVAYFDGHVDVFKWNDSLPFYSYRPHHNVIDQIEFSKTHNWIITRADDGLVGIWNWKEQKKVVDIFNIYSADQAYAMVTPESYYMMPPGVIREVHFVKGFQAYSVSQFDLVLNRPDKVLEGIGMADPKQIEMYKKAYLRRMQKNGLDPAAIKIDELPPLVIEGRNTIPSKTSNAFLPIKVKTKSKDVKEYLLYINNQLVEKANPSSNGSTEFKVALNEGANNVEVSYLTKKGIESLHERVEIQFESPSPISSKRYYIGIGVSSYKDSSRNLRYATKDVEDIRDRFKKSDSNTVVRLFTNEAVTKQQLQEIKQLLAQTTIHDQVIISFSGHGLLDTAYNFFFATHDMDFDNPAAKGLSYSDIETLFDNIPARKKLILIDACQSGSVEKELFSGEENKSNKNDSVKSYSRGGKQSANRNQSDLSSSIKLMQQYFADISKGQGAVVISASAGEENALESAEWKNGVFTFCFIQAVFEGKGDTNHDGHVSVSEVKEYMEREVVRLTNGRQRPASRKENLEWDWWIK